MIILKSPEQIEKMRQSGRLTALVLAEVQRHIEPGVATLCLEKIAQQLMKRNGANSGVLGYRGFPASICTSVNEEVVHGIPGKRRLLSGDLVSIDVSLQYQKYWGDLAATFIVGRNSPGVMKLVETAKNSLYLAIAQAKVGNHLSDISRTIQKCAERKGYSVIRAYSGHGIGQDLHEDPSVPGYLPLEYNPRLQVGMTLAIESMLSEGQPEVKILDDGWTAVTKDGGLACHFEHTVAITTDGPEILTQQ